MLFTLQRYEFFSKSQHRWIRNITIRRCCLPYKGTNFSANHNVILWLQVFAIDVVYPTKVRIFQQITTYPDSKTYLRLMLFTLQRYEFFSKSQRTLVQKYYSIRCCLPYKGTNFSANHNRIQIRTAALSDVVYPTKVRIFQQITTYER